MQLSRSLILEVHLVPLLRRLWGLSDIDQRRRFSLTVILQHYREQSTQPNAQSDTLAVACRVNAREIERLVAMW